MQAKNTDNSQRKRKTLLLHTNDFQPQSEQEKCKLRLSRDAILYILDGQG